MPSDDMNFLDHLRQFFDNEVEEEELRSLATHAVANDIRRLKPAISQAVWDSRQQSTIEPSSGAARLNEARQLHSMYVVALAEYSQITNPNKPAVPVADHSESDGGPNDDDSTRERQ